MVRRLCTALALVGGLTSGCLSDNAPADPADVIRGATDTDAGVPSVPSDAGSPSTPPDALAPRPRLRVLFIGNSYTAVNDVPGILTRIASTAATGPTIATEQVVEGGATLQTHLDEGVAQARIGEGGWTHVVLQGQSSEPTASDNSFFMSAAKQLGDLATKAGARPTWFVTWAYAKGAFSPPTVAEASAARMQDELTLAYADSMRQVPGSLLACVGPAFRRTIHDHPEIVLQQSDNSHASIFGSYLAAATFYVALTGSQVPSGSAVPAGIDARAAAILRDAARVGENCADAHVRGDVTLDVEPWWDDDAGNWTSSDFGTAARTVTRHLYLWNSGAVDVGIADGMTLAPPFAWSNGAYPGGVGVDPIQGDAYCSSTLAPQSRCALSVSYSGASTGAGAMSLNLTGAYQPQIVQAFQGTTTDRAHLAIRHVDPSVPIITSIGSTADFRLLVSNVGVAVAGSIAPALELSSPFGWGGGSDAFPGGAGSVDVGGATYEHCGAVLAAGDTCVVTLRFTPVKGGANPSTLGLESWSASPGQASTRDVVYARLFAWGLSPP